MPAIPALLTALTLSASLLWVPAPTDGRDLLPSLPDQTDFQSRLARAEAAIADLQRPKFSRPVIIGSGGLILQNGGNLTVRDTGSINIEGTGILKLREGIIDDEALANPLTPVRVHTDASGFSATTTLVTKMSVNVTVPEGRTRLLITNYIVSATMTNNTGGTDYLFTAPVVTGGALNGFSIGSPDVPAGASGVASEFRTGLLLDLTPGSALTFSGQVRTGFAPWTGGTGVGNLDMAGFWLR